MANRAVIIDILSDAKGFVKGSKEAEQAAGGLDSNVQQLGKTIVSTYAAKKVLDYGQEAVKAATEDAAAQKLLETALINATGATEAQVLATEDWITTTQLAKGVADSELRPALATLVGATKDVAEAQDLMGLSMDLARAKGISLEAASSAIAKAHGGNTTALVKLVPGLKEAGERSLDFATATERLNEQVKGQADAWAQTDEGKLARMNIAYDEMQEQIGAALLPVLGKLIGIVSSVFDWFNSLDQGTQDLIITVGLVAGGLYVAITAFNAARVAVTTLGISMQTAMPWLIGISVAVAAVAAAVAIFGDSESNAEKAVKSMSKSMLSSADAIDTKTIALMDATEAAEAFGEAIYAEADAKLQELIANSPEAVAAMQELGLSMDDVVTASHSQAGSMELLEQIMPKVTGNAIDGYNGFGTLAIALGGTAATTEETAKQMADLARVQDIGAIKSLMASGNFDLLTEAEQATALAALDAAAAAEEAAGGVEELGVESETTFGRMQILVDTTDELRKAFDAIIGPSMDLESAQRAVADAAQATTDTLIENGATLDMNTESGRANREVIQAQAEAALAQADAMVRSGSTTEEATAFALNYRDSLSDQLEMLGLTETEIDDYLTTLGMTPENVTTSLELANKAAVAEQLTEVLGQMKDVDAGAVAEIEADIAEGDFDAAVDKINALPGKHTVMVGVASDGSRVTLSNSGGAGFAISYREFGGPVSAGQPYIVGERRPELFVPKVDGSILPEVPKAFDGPGDGAPSRNNGQTGIDPTAFAAVVGPMIARAIRQELRSA